MANIPKFTPYPKSAPGDFYVESDQCMACGMPHVVAPDLIAWDESKSDVTLHHCFWKKQPEKSAEVERAIRVLETQELGCHRYAGTNPAILTRLSASYCDYPIAEEVRPRCRAEAILEGPHFLLLDGRPSLISRAWARLMRRQNTEL